MTLALFSCRAGEGRAEPRRQAGSKCGQQKIILRLKIRKITPGGEERPARTQEPRKFAAGSATRGVERRGQAETDPIKKARIAQFLKEYWGVREGKGGDRRSKDKMPLKTIDDIAETLGETERNTRGTAGTCGGNW